MLLYFLILLLGFILLIKGAGWLVDGSSSLAKKHNISQLAIGLTIVAFGTSAPELVVNSIASWKEYDGLTFGNVIGSNNLNLFAILGIAGIITPLAVQRSTVWKEIPISFFAAALLFFLVNDNLFGTGRINQLSRIDGLILLTAFGFFLYYVYLNLREEQTETSETIIIHSTWKMTLLIVGGLISLIIGGKLIVDNAVLIAKALDVSEKLIGLTIVSVGTSLPELATSVVAAKKGKNDIAIGNVIGSNIFNIFFILSVSSLIHPAKFDTELNQDIILLFIGTLMLFIAMFSGKKRKLDRWESGILLLAYFGYLYLLFYREA
jgi:cation:H+ antiporter